LPAEFAQAANVHLSAVEHDHGIVFLHAVSEGPANQSYGLQVAQLAGVPPAVIKAARKHLAHLEQQSIGQPSPQFDLFAAPVVEIADAHEHEEPAEAQPHPALDRLRAIDPNELRPRDALDLLYELHELASNAPDASH
jgi:DNA mismatch repair protein MutS